MRAEHDRRKAVGRGTRRHPSHRPYSPLVSPSAHVRLSVITPHCLRLEFSRTGRFVDVPSVVAQSRTPSQVVTSSRIGEVIELATPGVRLRVVNDGLPFHPGNTRAKLTAPDFEPLTWHPGDEPHRNLGGTLSSLDGVRGPVDIGHGLLTRDGWFLLDDSHSPVLVDGWPTPRESVTAKDHDLHSHRDWYLFSYGHDYAAALHSLAALTGPVALPPRALLGSWYSRFWPYSADEFKEIVNQYAAHGFGLDVLVLDMDWHTRTGWTGWSWNRTLIPDPPGLLTWLHDRGLTVTLNLHPADGVGPHEERYAEFMLALGRDPWGASLETAPFDPGDRAYMDALANTVLKPLQRDGVDFWWLDWQQHHFTPSVPGLTNLRQLNGLLAGDSGDGPGAQDLPLAREARIKPRPAILSRWAGWGDQRHPVQFSGDAHGGWRALAFEVPFTASAGNVLCCFWSHDIGGHFGKRDEECMARWVQFGAVSAALRLHSAHAAALDRRPWTCAPVFTESMRRAFALRATLMPTIYSAAQRSATESIPLLRPMYFDNPGDERAYATAGQYMLGDLLVAPITTPGAGERRVALKQVWFPTQISRRRADGAQGESPNVEAWHHWFTGERFKPGAEALVAADIDEFPLFAPAGVPILLADRDHPMGSSVQRTLTIRVFPMGPRRRTSTVLREDDGTSTAYLDSGAATTDIHVATGHTFFGIDIEPTRGTFSGQLRERAYIIELPLLTTARGASINNDTPIDIEFLPATADAPAMGRILVPPRPIIDKTHIGIRFPQSDLGFTNRGARLRRLRAAIADAVPESTARDALLRLARSAHPNLATALCVAAGFGIQQRDDGTSTLIDSYGLAENARVRVTLIDELPPHPHSRIDIGTLVLNAPPGTAVPLPEPHPLAEPAPGLRASRIARVEFTNDAEPVAFETVLRSSLAPIRRWRIAGPFPFDDRLSIVDQHHAPDRGEPTPWRTISAESSAQAEPAATYAVDLNRHVGPGGRLVYAVTAIAAPRSLDATLHLEAADRLEAWVNGEKVFSDDPGETMDSARGSARIRLLAGTNELRLKLTRGGAGFGFTAAIDAGDALTELG